jgi:hypothetical protein
MQFCTVELRRTLNYNAKGGSNHEILEIDWQRIYNGSIKDLSSIFRWYANPASPPFDFPPFFFSRQPSLSGSGRRPGSPPGTGSFNGLADE